MPYHTFMAELIEARLTAITEPIGSAQLRVLAEKDGQLLVRKLDVPASDDEVRLAVGRLAHELGL